MHITHWLAVSYNNNKKESLRWGWTLSRKVGNAVTRNRLKRWGRESVRRFKTNELDVNFIFKVKKSGFYKDLTRGDFDEAIQKAFQKIG